MDDPWGSPWADEHNNNTDAPLEVEVKPVPSVKALLQKNNETAPVPWGESDDGFGEWASMPADVVEHTGGLEFGTSSYTWSVADKETDRGQLEEGINGDSMSWNHPTAGNERNETSKLSPREISRIVREPSPDPWATKSVNDNIAHVAASGEPEAPNQEVAFNNNVVLEASDIAVAEQILSSPGDERPNGKAVENGLEEQTAVESVERLDTYGENTEPVEDIEVAVKSQENDHESSRPSTSPSDNNPQDDIPDSPRTSLDEDIKRPSMPRQVSSKVHDLVEHFDGLAKVEASEEVTIDTRIQKDNDGPTDYLNSQDSHSINESVEADEADEADDDFGDFEEGTSELGDEEPPTTPILPKARPQNPSAPTTPDVRSLSVGSPDYTPRKEVVKKEFGRIEFPVENSYLAELFPGINNEHSEKIFIPDVVPHNSFTSVEQRKTWYRLSRFGTMKRHDMGDDENYVRTTWAQSQARAGTLKIVARWLEEDRISGRVVLGGGSKGSSLFGWNDDSAGTVPLASAFAKPAQKMPRVPAAPVVEPEIPREWPKGLVRTHSSSKPRSSSKSRRRSSTKSSIGSMDIKREDSMPVANFGWSSEGQDVRPQSTILPPGNPASIPQKKSGTRQQNSVLRDISIPENTSERRQVPSVKGISVLSPIMQTPTTVEVPPVVVRPALNSILADDDDWGEMISTPPTTTASKFPAVKVLNPVATSPSSFVPLPREEIKKATIDSMPRHSVINHPPAKVGTNRDEAKVLRDSVIPNIDISLSKTFDGDPTFAKNTGATTNQFSTDDLDPWGSPSLGNSAGNNNASLFDTFATKAVSISQPKPLSAESEPDPWETPIVPANREPTTFDATKNKSLSVSKTIVQIPVVPASYASTSSADPWATVDFSFFDTPETATVTATPTVISKTTVHSVAKPKKSVGFSTVASQVKHTPSPLPQAVALTASNVSANKTAPPPVRREGLSKADIEQEKIVTGIINRLPDLSYMLRR